MGKDLAAILLMKRWLLVWQLGGDESLMLPILGPGSIEKNSELPRVAVRTEQAEYGVLT